MVIKLRQSYDCVRIFDKETARPEIYPDQHGRFVLMIKMQYPESTIVAGAPRYSR